MIVTSSLYYDSRTKRCDVSVPRHRKKSWPSIQRPMAGGWPSPSSPRPAPRGRWPRPAPAGSSPPLDGRTACCARAALCRCPSRNARAPTAGERGTERGEGPRPPPRAEGRRSTPPVLSGEPIELQLVAAARPCNGRAAQPTPRREAAKLQARSPPKLASAAACPSPASRAGLCTASRVGSRPVGGRTRPSPPPGLAAHARWTAPGCPLPVAPLVAGLARYHTARPPGLACCARGPEMGRKEQRRVTEGWSWCRRCSACQRRHGFRGAVREE